MISREIVKFLRLEGATMAMHLNNLGAFERGFECITVNV